jgi:protein-disulfide isomerase
MTATRQERRRLELEQRRDTRRRQREAPKPAPWRSPMAMFTIGALLIGAVIVGYALLQQPGAPSDDLIHPPGVIPAGLADGRTLGVADAPVVIEIWSDFQCPACQQLAERVEPSIITNFVVPGTARLVYRDAAYQGARAGGSYDESVESAAAARCAGEQNKFWQMHSWIFANWNGENRGAFSPDRLRAMASGAGLDLAAYDLCIAVGDKQTAVRAETQQASATGINSTPTMLINGVAYVGLRDYTELAQAIRQAAGQ